MCHRNEPPQQGFPRYDECTQIDSAAIVPDRVKQFGEPRVDPRATAYTERYCEEQKPN